MDINCPECGASFSADETAKNTCPACMFSFSTDRETSLPHLMEIEVQGQNGENIGVMDIYKIRELIYAGRLKGKELVRPLSGDWIPIGDLLSLKQIFKLKGIDIVSVKVQAQKIKGWKTEAKPKPKKRRRGEKPVQVIAPRESTKVNKPKKILVPLIVTLSAIAAAVWLFSS